MNFGPGFWQLDRATGRRCRFPKRVAKMISLQILNLRPAFTAADVCNTMSGSEKISTPNLAFTAPGV